MPSMAIKPLHDLGTANLTSCLSPLPLHASYPAHSAVAQPPQAQKESIRVVPLAAPLPETVTGFLHACIFLMIQASGQRSPFQQVLPWYL